MYWTATNVAYMDAQALLDIMRRRGYGVTINLWAEDSDVAVVLWRNGNPVASGRADTSLYFALEDAVAHIPEV